MKLKYLYRRPKSATEVMNIIKETYDSFHEQQDINKKVKNDYEQNLFSRGIYEGTQVRVTSRSDIKDHVGIIKSINKNIVRFEDLTEPGQPKMWKLRGFDFEKV